MVIKFLRKDELAASEVYRSRDWGADAAEAMCKEVRGFKVPGGKSGQQTLGDYIDRTPKECIGKVRLEEIVFETWFNGHAVLIGDGKRIKWFDFQKNNNREVSGSCILT